jgi:hypothetical protein
MAASRAPAVVRPDRADQRRLFIDLSDLHLPGYLAEPDQRAAVTAHVYERFTPFADDGWEWTVFPGQLGFDGWVYETIDGHLTVVGVDLLCRRLRRTDPLWSDPTHHVSEHRVRQLTGFAWTGAKGSKLWREPEHSEGR